MAGSILGNIIGFAYGAEQERRAQEEINKLPEYQQLQNINETATLYDTLLRIFERADAEDKPTSTVADQMAQEIIARGPL